MQAQKEAAAEEAAKKKEKVAMVIVCEEWLCMKVYRYTYIDSCKTGFTQQIN